MKILFNFLRNLLSNQSDSYIAHASAPDIAVASASEALMHISPKGIDLIASFECFKESAYLCPAGVWTIGYGTTMINGHKVKKGDRCTVAEAKQYKMQDIHKFEKTVNQLVKVALTQNQFDALVSLNYNIGTRAFSQSTLLKKLNAGDYVGAAEQFEVWNRAGGKVVQGLVNRRKVEKKLFLQ